RPATSVSPAAGRRSRSASSFSTASLARPRSGGAATRTFQASPRRPTSSVLRAPGETRTRIRVVGSGMPDQYRQAFLRGLAALRLVDRAVRLGVFDRGERRAQERSHAPGGDEEHLALAARVVRDRARLAV